MDTSALFSAILANLQAVAFLVGFQLEAYAKELPIAEGTQYEIRLDEWIEELSEKESGNNAKVKVKDVNGRYSYGCLQFQWATWTNYLRRYSLPVASSIFDCEAQKDLASRMILEDYGNWRHWRCSVEGCPQYGIKGIGMPPHDKNATQAKIEAKTAILNDAADKTNRWAKGEPVISPAVKDPLPMPQAPSVSASHEPESVDPVIPPPQGLSGEVPSVQMPPEPSASSSDAPPPTPTIDAPTSPGPTPLSSDQAASPSADIARSSAPTPPDM
jgi:hypothetical protein